MLIDYYRQADTLNLSSESSPIYRSHQFSLMIVEDSLTGEEKQFENTEIRGILNKLPALHYTTKWGNSPAAKVTDVVKKITEHKYLKMFAKNNANYRPPIVTDGWTQQVPQSADPISYDLEFRSYPIEMMNTTPYNRIIDFLISATTPKKYLFSSSVEYIESAAELAYKRGEELAEMLNELSHNFDTNVEYSKVAAVKRAIEMLDEDESTEKSSTSQDPTTAKEEALAKAISGFIKELNKLSNMSERNTGGCPLIKAYIPGLSNNTTQNVPWIITSWSFKPAINTTDNDFPIYVDFKITIETQYALTSDDLLLD